VAYRNAIYNGREGIVNLFTWDQDGNRIMTTASHDPYLYVEKNTGDKVSIFGTKLEKKRFQNNYLKAKFLKDSGVKRVFENMPAAQQFLLDAYWRDNEKSDFSEHPLKYCLIDIETFSVDHFPDVDNPTHTINVITCYDNFSKKFHTFGLKPYTAELQNNVIYTHCDNERELLIKFIEYMEADYPDILSGWNSEGFDIPYIINRMGHILGEDYVKRLSPVSNIYYRVMRGQFGQEKKRYYIDGISCLDFLDIYKRFCLKLRESYKLDAIGEVELGEKKVDYSGMSLAELSERDWNKFIDYNIQDVNLLVRLEQKLQYLPLLRMLSYVGLTTLEGAMGTLQVINGALCIKARQRGEVISTFIRSDSEGKNPGAYVAEPKSGFKNHIISFDANSLYPNVMISLNTSPETKVGKVDIIDDKVIIQHVSGKQFSLDKPSFAKFLKKEECSLSKAGFMFTQKKKGIIPEFLEYYYNKRVEIKEKLFKAKQKLKKDSDNIDLKYEVERLNTEQMVIKILVNSCYGYMGNKRAPIGDDDIASSVTLTGQAVIKESNKQLKKYINANIDKEITDRDLEECIIYNDTDSSYISITPLIENGIKFWEDREKGLIHQETYDEIQRIEDSLNEGIAIWARKALLTKDPRFVFKRECIADTGTFLQKKRYVMHILDDEGIKENKFKYTGVEVVRTTMPNAIKPYAKKIIETMLSTQSLKETNKVLYETYDIFKTLSPEQIAFVMGVKGYEKYAVQCKQFTTCKGMPIHVKSAYYYNEMLDILETGNKYEKLSSGDKVRYLYIQQPNKYRLDTIGFKYEFPEELGSIFKVDYEKMFEKILFQGIERFYNSVSWPIRKPANNVQTELFELFA
jgi:DNA polymerase elongation subunit (family B)